MEARFGYMPAPGARWPHRFEIMAHATYTEVMTLCEPVRAWCAEQSIEMWIDVNGSFYLKQEADALAFRLRWC